MKKKWKDELKMVTSEPQGLSRAKSKSLTPFKSIMMTNDSTERETIESRITA